MHIFSTPSVSLNTIDMILGPWGLGDNMLANWMVQVPSGSKYTKAIWVTTVQNIVRNIPIFPAVPLAITIDSRASK